MSLQHWLTVKVSRTAQIDVEENSKCRMPMINVEKSKIRINMSVAYLSRYITNGNVQVVDQMASFILSSLCAVPNPESISRIRGRPHKSEIMEAAPPV